MKKNIIITGIPRSGKSTLMKELVSGRTDAFGSVAEEVWRGERVGFKYIIGGRELIFSGKDIVSNFNVSRYGVDLDVIREVSSLLHNFLPHHLLYLDEIGEMQVMSKAFRELIGEYLDSDNISIFTMSSVYADDFINSIKSRGDIILIEINKKNRKEKLEFARKLISKIEKSRKYASEPGRFKVGYNYVSIKTDHGEKYLKFFGGQWKCDCEFYGEHEICSHVLALERRRIEGMEFKIKKDKYRRARGNYSKVLDVSCVCGEHLCYYQKDGPGILKRMYVDRIFGNIHGNVPLSCGKCGKIIGVPMIYEKEDRPALRVIRGTTIKKQVRC